MSDLMSSGVKWFAVRFEDGVGGRRSMRGGLILSLWCTSCDVDSFATHVVSSDDFKPGDNGRQRGSRMCECTKRSAHCTLRTQQIL